MILHKKTKTNMTEYNLVLLRQKTKMTKHKKSKYKCDKMQKDRIQIWKNAKGQNTNVTKYKNTIKKYDKTQKTIDKCDNIQKD